jgi:hypothetical protein
MDYDLEQESLADVYVLLRSFVDGLTGVDRIKIKRQDELHDQRQRPRFLRKKKPSIPTDSIDDAKFQEEDAIFHPQRLTDMIDDSCIPTRIDFTRRTEPSVIEAAQCYLRLLPPAQLSLFCYLARFGTEVYKAVDEARSNNTVQLDAISHTMALWFFASPSRSIERMDNMMKFFFKNWSRIERHLYSMAFDESPVSVSSKTPASVNATTTSISEEESELEEEDTDSEASSLQWQPSDTPGGLFGPPLRVSTSRNDSRLHLDERSPAHRRSPRQKDQLTSYHKPRDVQEYSIPNTQAQDSLANDHRKCVQSGQFETSSANGKPVSYSSACGKEVESEEDNSKRMYDGLPTLRGESFEFEEESPRCAYDGIAYEEGTPRQTYVDSEHQSNNYGGECPTCRFHLTTILIESIYSHPISTSTMPHSFLAASARDFERYEPK